MRHCWLLLVLLIVAARAAASAPQQVWFTWQGDTGTTLTVNYQTLGHQMRPAQVFYDTESRGGKSAAYRYQRRGSSFRLAGLGGRWLHRVELTGLEPGASVWLVAGDPALGVSREFQVRTIPHGEEPLRFVTGGDMGVGEDTRRLLRAAAATSPHFALVGGDVAYANGALENVGLWDTWLTYWTEEMVTPDGRAIPLVVAIGNHEVQGGYGGSRDQAPFFFGFFGQDPQERTYFTRRFGRDLVVFILDTGHIARYDGAQLEWLGQALAEHRDVRFKAALYHVPLYPSHRDYDGGGSAAGRALWLPLFDQHQLTVAFENHDHTYKRSRLLRGNAVVAEGGTLYLGDGCWGRTPRTVTYGGRWYLERAAPVLHFWAAELTPRGLTYRAINDEGRVFDVYPEGAPGAEEAAANFAGLELRYQWPDQALRASNVLVAEDEITSGTTTLQLSNPLPFPVEVVLGSGRVPKGARWMDLPLTLTLEPGQTATHAVSFAAERPIPVEGADFRLKFEARGRSDAAATEHFEDEVRVRVQRSSGE